MDDVQTRSTRPPMAPRHLRRRRFLPEIPEGRFVGDFRPSAVSMSTNETKPRRKASQLDVLEARAANQKRKRRAALAIVVLVIASILVLGLALFLSL